MQTNAVISDCGLYRYALTRRWGEGPMALFVMLNPSTADANEDDPTIRRCIGFAKREGCGALRVENLYGIRATDPNAIWDNTNDPVGLTCGYIAEALKECQGPAIAGWGAHRFAYEQAPIVMGIADRAERTLQCLGVTKSGAPRHPLYLKSDAPLLALH